MIQEMIWRKWDWAKFRSRGLWKIPNSETYRDNLKAMKVWKQLNESITWNKEELRTLGIGTFLMIFWKMVDTEYVPMEFNVQHLM